MNIESEMAISLLKLTLAGPVSKELIYKEAKLPATTAYRLLRKMQNERLVYLEGSLVKATSIQRVKLAVLAVQTGADLERATSLLDWREFEAISATSFEENGYEVTRNMHFKYVKRRFEIDLVCSKGSLVVCADCKHWQRALRQSSALRIVEEQIQRTSALAKSLPNPSVKSKCFSARELKFFPAVLSLVASTFRFCDNVPIVPVLQLQDFISQLPAIAHCLKHFDALGSNLTLDS